MKYVINFIVVFAVVFVALFLMDQFFSDPQEPLNLILRDSLFIAVFSTLFMGLMAWHKAKR